MLRAEEEITRLKEEMSNCIQHFIGIYNYLTQTITSLNQNHVDVCDIGRICLLIQDYFNFITATDIAQLENFLLSLDDSLEAPLHNSPGENEETVSILLPQSLIDELSDCEERDDEDNCDMLDLISDDGKVES